MEYSLHRQLKEHYAGEDSPVEVRMPGYRIDVVRNGELIEIQHGKLAAIRDKVRKLSVEHLVRVVKPIVVTKQLIKRARKRGRVVDRRFSPKRGKLLDLFAELVHFTRTFPHPQLVLEAVLVEVEEWRYPGHGRRRWKRQGDFIVEDQKLVNVLGSEEFATAHDLLRLLPHDLSPPFDSGDLAEAAGIPRNEAQRILYCLRKMGGVLERGKRGNTLLYQWPDRSAA